MLTALVFILTLVSIVTMNITATNYVEVAKATQKMEAHLVNLEIEGDTVFLTFRFNNDSSLDIVLVNVQFNIVANKKYVGNYGTRERIILGPGETDIVVRAEVHSYYLMKLIGYGFESIQSYLYGPHEIHWFVDGAAVIELPFEETTVNVEIEEQWVSE